MTTAVKPNLEAINDESIMTTLKEVVSASPDYVYKAPDYQVGDGVTNCYYVHNDEDGKPQSAGCLIGKVLERLGVPLSMLATVEGSRASTAIQEVAWDQVSYKTRRTLTQVQMFQDDGNTWGESYVMVTGDTL